MRESFRNARAMHCINRERMSTMIIDRGPNTKHTHDELALSKREVAPVLRDNVLQSFWKGSNCLLQMYITKNVPYSAVRVLLERIEVVANTNTNSSLSRGRAEQKRTMRRAEAQPATEQRRVLRDHSDTTSQSAETDCANIDTIDDDGTG